MIGASETVGEPRAVHVHVALGRLAVNGGIAHVPRDGRTRRRADVTKDDTGDRGTALRPREPAVEHLPKVVDAPTRSSVVAMRAATADADGDGVSGGGSKGKKGAKSPSSAKG